MKAAIMSNRSQGVSNGRRDRVIQHVGETDVMDERLPHEMLLAWIQSWVVDPLEVYGNDRNWRQLVFVFGCCVPSVLMCFIGYQRLAAAVDSTIVLAEHQWFWLVVWSVWAFAVVLAIPAVWSGDNTILEGLARVVLFAIASAVAVVIAAWGVTLLGVIVSFLLWTQPPRVIVYPFVVAAGLGFSWLMYYVLIPGAIHFTIEGVAASYHEQDTQDAVRFLESMGRGGMERVEGPADSGSGREFAAERNVVTGAIDVPPQPLEEPQSGGAMSNSRGRGWNSQTFEMQDLPPGMVESFHELIDTAERQGGGLSQIVQAYLARIKAQARRRNYQKMTELWKELRHQTDAFYDAYMSSQRVKQMRKEAYVNERELELRMKNLERKLRKFEQEEMSDVEYALGTIADRKQVKVANAEAKLLEAKEHKRLREEAKKEFADEPEVLKRVLAQIDAIFGAGDA